jgi:hypothetical protein
MPVVAPTGPATRELTTAEETRRATVQAPRGSLMPLAYSSCNKYCYCSSQTALG